MRAGQWGRDFYRHLSKGMDHGSAAYLADKAEAERKRKQQKRSK